MKLLSKSDLKECVEILKKDGIIAFPTETVFGLGVKADSEKNYENLVRVKHRPSDKPFTLMCSSIKDFEKFVEIDAKTKRIIDKYMPGPITLILKTKIDVPYYIDLGTGFVGVRIPDDKFVLEMIKEAGEPLLVPSANISSFPPAKNHREVIEYFKDTIDGVVEGECKDGVPSSIFKIENDKITLIRKGPISLEEVEEIYK